jgi:hypothetical protein
MPTVMITVMLALHLFVTSTENSPKESTPCLAKLFKFLLTQVPHVSEQTRPLTTIHAVLLTFSHQLGLILLNKLVSMVQSYVLLVADLLLVDAKSAQPVLLPPLALTPVLPAQLVFSLLPVPLNV